MRIVACPEAPKTDDGKFIVVLATKCPFCNKALSRHKSYKSTIGEKKEAA